jgi:hypothetical protein
MVAASRPLRHPGLAASLLLLLMLLAGSASAENFTRRGEFTVHHNAVQTTTLSPDMARQYGFLRSANRVLLNVAVRRGEPGTDRAVAAVVRASATNLAGQRQDLRMIEVREGDAIYYLGEASISGHDWLNFDISAKPEGGSEIRSRFRLEFFGE